MAQLEFELAYYDVIVQHISQGDCTLYTFEVYVMHYIYHDLIFWRV